MSVIPAYESALEFMVAHVKPGGWIVIADAKHSARWYARPFNWVALLLSWGAAGVMSRHPWETLVEKVDDFVCREWFLGFFYGAAGCVYGNSE